MRGRVLVAATLAWIAPACATTPPTQFYVLHSLAASSTDVASPAPTAGGPAVGVGPIELPQYLNRPNIVKHVGPQELDIAQFHQWAEPLKDGFARALSEDLAVLLPTDRTMTFPWRGPIRVDYQVLVWVTRFDGDTDGNAVLRARWTILDGRNREPLVSRESQLRRPASDAGFPATVEARSQAVAALAGQIADALREIAPAEAEPG